MTPQYDITKTMHMHIHADARFTFLGRAYELDVYKNNRLPGVYRVVGPYSITRGVRSETALGWTSFNYDPITNHIKFRDEDVRVGVPHLVEIYGLVTRSV